MPEFLYRIQPTRLGMLTEGPTDDESAVLAEHAGYVERLAGQGVVEFAGRTQNADESTFGIVIFHAADEAAAREIVEEDPAVKHGVMEAALFPYRIAYTSDALAKRARIADTITALFVATDRKDWAGVRACFADRVTFDMTSLVGGNPAEMSPEEITAGWEEGLAPIEAVHHQIGNLSIRCEGAEAKASCYGIAYHYRRTASGKDTRTFVGSYDFRLRNHGNEWRIDLFRFRLKFVDGNLALDSEPGG